MKIILQRPNSHDTYDITRVCSEGETSADYQNVYRIFKFKYLNPTTDRNMVIQDERPNEMDWIYAYDEEDNNKELFRGQVWKTTKDTSSEYMDFECYDPLYRLTLDTIVKVYYNVTPEDIVKQIAGEYNVALSDNVAVTGVQGNYVALGKTPYEIIMGAYTRASKQTGKKYLPRIKDGKLEVIIEGNEITPILLDPESNLKSSKYETDVSQMVNKVVIYKDEDGSTVDTVENSDWQNTYGILQQAIAYEKDKDNNDIANKALKDIDRKCEVDSIGYNDAIIGNCIFIKDEVSGVVGKFFVQGDDHTYSENVHSMKLTLSFEYLMDEKDIPDKFESKTEDSSSSSSDGSGKGSDIVSYAESFCGVPYVWGGTTPSGFDCSGFVQYVFAHFGIDLPRVSEDQINCGTPVTQDELQPGDLVFPRADAGHVQIYVGNGQVVHSPHTGDVVKVADMYGFYAGRRVM